MAKTPVTVSSGLLTQEEFDRIDAEYQAEVDAETARLLQQMGPANFKAAIPRMREEITLAYL